MLPRLVSNKLKNLFQKFPILAILGPRQSGKTTLAREVFPELTYINLEDITFREFAEEDPKGFLENYSDGAILDEIQYVPKLFSYLQVFTDYANKPSQFVLTGSQNFVLNDKISQSLAGRVAITTLFPLSYNELQLQEEVSLNELIYTGFYPRLWSYGIDPKVFYGSYITTYLEKDLRQIKNIQNLSQFQKFLKLCAGRCGQTLNLSNIGNDCGISNVTAREWLTLLEMSYIIYLLPPYSENFNKKIIKSPKLYFYDTGILCYLLNITSQEQLEFHFAKGAIFENFIITEIIKNEEKSDRAANLYFWRDKLGHEVDLIIEKGYNQIIPIEIKSGQTISKDYFKNLKYFNKLKPCKTNYLIYTGKENQTREGIKILNWKNYLYSNFC